MDGISVLLIIICIFAFYLIPTIIAFSEKKKNTSSIAVVNIFLGWTLIGWIVALAWAVSKDKETNTIIHNHTPEKDHVADKLEKLATLKEKGHITEEEYSTQKSKLLS